MQGIKQIGSIMCTAMAVFLFSYSVSFSFASSKVVPQVQHDTFAKNGNQPANPDTQFPYEEKDKERGDEFQDSFSMVCVPEEIFSLASITNQYCFINQAHGSDNIIARVPIYLAKRALII